MNLYVEQAVGHPQHGVRADEGCELLPEGGPCDELD